MAVTFSDEELDLFNKNGISDDDIQATVENYRSQGLDDNAIRQKVDVKLNALKGAVVTPELKGQNGETVTESSVEYPTYRTEQGQVKKTWFHPVDFTKSLGKGVYHGVNALGIGLGKRVANPLRQAMGKQPLTDYEIENIYGKMQGLPEQGGAYKTGKFVGETAPYFLLPETKLAGLGTWGNRALTYGYQGGLAGGLNSIAEKGLNPKENLKDAGISAVGAIALGSAVAKGGDKLARLQRARNVMKRRNTPLAERMTAEQTENAYINRGLNKRLDEIKQNPDVINDENFYKGLENLPDNEQTTLLNKVEEIENGKKINELKIQRQQNQQAKAEEIARINAERQEALKGASFNNPSAKINKQYDKQIRQAQQKYNSIENDLKGQMKDLSPEKTDLNSLKSDIGDVAFPKSESQYSYETNAVKGNYFRRNIDDPMTYDAKTYMQKFNKYVQDIKNNPSLVDDEAFMLGFQNDLKNAPDFMADELSQKIDELVTRARKYNEFKLNKTTKPEWEQITDAEYNAINNPVDDVVTPETPKTTIEGTGTKTSKFVDTVDNSNLASESIKGQANATYQTISNKETLSKAQSIIDEDLQGAINRVLTTEKPSEVEIAMGEDLVRRLQATGREQDTELAIKILEKTASDLTKAGRTVQSARIWQALTPEGSLMAYQRAIRKNTPPHIQEVLDNARGIINKVKTAQTSEEAEKILRDSLKELNPSAKNKIVKQLKNAYEKGEVDVESLENAIKKQFKLKTMTESDRVELNQLVENIQNAQTDREREIATALLKRKIEEVTPASLGRKVSTLQAGAQLLNPKTILRNILGNTNYGLLEDVTQSGIATPIDKLVSKFTGERSIVPTNLKTQIGGLGRGAKLGLEDIKYGIDTSANAGKYDLWGGRTFRDGGLGGAIEKGMNYTLRLPDRMAYTAVYDEAIENMLRAQGVKNVTREMIENAPQHIKDQANLEALERTFQDDSALAKAGQGLKRFLNLGKDFGFGDLVLKYAKTPSNILQRGIDYSPIGLGRGVYDFIAPAVNKSLPFNQRQAVMDLSRGLMGTGLMGTGLGLKELVPNLQGERESNNRLRQNLMAQGYRPYSIPIGNKAYTYDWNIPTSIPFSAGVNWGNGGDFVESLLGSVNTLAEQPLLSGLQKVAGGGITGFGEGVADVGLGAVNSFIPALLRQTAQTIDPYYRDTSGTDKGLMGKAQRYGNMFRSNIPVWSMGLPQKMDVTGQPILRGDNVLERGFNTFINPANVSKITNNPTLNTSVELYNQTNDTSALYPVAPVSIKIDGANKRLTNKEKSAYQEKLGRITDSIRSNLLEDENFANLTAEEQIKEFDKYNKAINNAIKYKMFGTQPKTYKSLTNEILEYYDEY